MYFYHFATRPSFYDNKILSLKRSLPVTKADHYDDFVFFFGFPFLSGVAEKGLTFTEEEKVQSKNMMRMLASFAETG